MSAPNWWGDWRPILTPHTGNLQPTDLLECTSIVGGLPVNTAITGAQIIAAASSGAIWGSITGTLSNQTDLQTALNAKQATLVSGTNIKTINGNSILGSGDLTVGGSGLTVGTTAITSGTIGRVLFQGTGNVLQQSTNLFWDNTNNRLGVGTSSPSFPLDVNGTARVQTSLAVTTGKTFSAYTSSAANDALKLEVSNLGAVFGVQNSNASGFSGIEYLSNAGVPRVFTGFNNGNGQEFRFNNFASGGYIDFLIGSTSGLRIANTRNILINTTTDAGFKLDVNGSSRATSLVINGTTALFNSGISVFQNSTNRAFSVSASVTKTNGAERILFSLNSSELTNQQAMDFGYIGASALTNRYFYLQSSESGVGYGGGVVLQHNGGWASVGTSSYVASAIFNVNSTNRGFLPPRMTTTQKNAIASPAAGLVVYDTTLNKLCVRTASAWETITSV
jgi:hypothetical protein